MKNNIRPFYFHPVIFALMLYVFSGGFATAALLGIGNMTITGGSYVVTGSDGVLIFNPSSGSTVSPFTTFGLDTNLVGGYLGNGGGAVPATMPDATSVVGNLWFGIPVNSYTAAVNLGDLFSPAGSITGGPIPSGTLDDTNGTIAMDLSSFFGNWSNFDIHMGTGKNDGITSALASGTWNPVTGAYTLSWTTVVDNTVGGPCLPTHCVAYFTLEGIATAEPVPSDTTPPVITSSITGALGNNGWYVGPVTLSWSVVDNESSISSQSGCSSVTLSDDTTGTTLTCSATSAGGTSTNSVTIKIDQTNPNVACSTSPSVLWPSNHNLVDITAMVSVVDSTSGPDSFSLLSVTSNEPDSGLIDMQGWNTGTDDTGGQLRAERLGTGTGRLYTLNYQGQDRAGNSGMCLTTVTVPHDQRQ